jgi:hypothetical protein
MPPEAEKEALWSLDQSIQETRKGPINHLYYAVNVTCGESK